VLTYCCGHPRKEEKRSKEIICEISSKSGLASPYPIDVAHKTRGGMPLISLYGANLKKAVWKKSKQPFNIKNDNY